MNTRTKTTLFQVIGVVIIIVIWSSLTLLNVFPKSAFPSPLDVAAGFPEELRNGRLFFDVIASLCRVMLGFSLAAILGIPLGLWLALHSWVRLGLTPAINFFRSLSPLAWIPFAVLWFGIGDAPVVFLIFMATFFPLVLMTIAAVASIPAVYFRIAEEYGFRGIELLTGVVLFAILPHLITGLRVTVGMAWLVVVAAEMIAGREGLGFAIWDARNGLRTDLLVCNMIVIGIIGVILDRFLIRLMKLQSVRWGYES